MIAAGCLSRALDWFAGHGVQGERLLLANGSCYVSRAFKAQVEATGLRHSFTRPYRPQTNGKAERFIQALIRGWAYAKPSRVRLPGHERSGPGAG